MEHVQLICVCSSLNEKGSVSPETGSVVWGCPRLIFWAVNHQKHVCSQHTASQGGFPTGADIYQNKCLFPSLRAAASSTQGSGHLARGTPPSPAKCARKARKVGAAHPSWSWTVMGKGYLVTKLTNYHLPSMYLSKYPSIHPSFHLCMHTSLICVCAFMWYIIYHVLYIMSFVCFYFHGWLFSQSMQSSLGKGTPA